MKDFNELRQLWLVQGERDGVGYEAILQNVRQSKNKYTARLLSHVLSIGIIVLITLYIFIRVPFYTWTTQLSMLIILVCLVYYLITQIRDYRNIHRSEQLLATPREYMEYLTAYKQHRYRFNTRNYTVYTLCISIALLLYLVEMSFYVSLITLICFMVGAISWFLVCYFVLMKMYIKKESERLEEWINRLGSLSEQFAE